MQNTLPNERPTMSAKHFITLTRGQYKTLRKLTDGSLEYQTELIRSLRTELSRSLYAVRRSQYHVRFTCTDLETAAYVLRVHALRHGNGLFNRLMRDYGYLLGPGGEDA